MNHAIDVIRALAEICVPPLTVARLFELLECERNETVRRGLVEVIRQRAARGEGREVAECYVRLMVRRGARELTAERVQKAVGVSLRVAGEVLMEYARGGVYRTRREGHRVTVYRLQPVENGRDGENPVHLAGQEPSKRKIRDRIVARPDGRFSKWTGLLRTCPLGWTGLGESCPEGRFGGWGGRQL
jgi:hypothetical protein